MEQNKTGKYLKYAIGEIILVMLGILLALQVSNWNEIKKNNNYVSLILKEIYYDLSDDYRIIYQAVEPRLKRKQQGVSIIKEFMLNGEVPEGYAFTKHYDAMKQGFSLTQRTGAFESLKLGGLDKINNDSLRTQLLEFYESDIPRHVSFINQNDDLIKERVGILEADLFDYEFIAIDDSTKIHAMRSRTNDFINHQSMHIIFDMLSEDTRHKNYRLQSLKRNYNYTMSMIERELEKREIQFEYLDTTALKRDF